MNGIAKKIRIVLADDHQIVREALKSILESEEDFEVVGEAENGVEAIELVRRLHPDAVVMDVNMPKMNGIEATRQIKREADAKIIGLSLYSDRVIAEAMKEAGATAYISKDAPSPQLLRAIREASEPHDEEDENL